MRLLSEQSKRYAVPVVPEAKTDAEFVHQLSTAVANSRYGVMQSCGRVHPRKLLLYTVTCNVSLSRGKYERCSSSASAFEFRDMGNTKNKVHQWNDHRHVYRKKALPGSNTSESSTSTGTSSTTDSSPTDTIASCRIINIQKLQQYIGQLTPHTTKCGGSVVISGESRDGLASILSTKCSVCGHTIALETAQKVIGPDGYRRWECNLAAVRGQMATGGGHSQLEETMSVLGVPVMSKNSFTQTQHGIGEWWRLQLAETMTAAGKEEKRLAEERGDYPMKEC